MSFYLGNLLPLYLHFIAANDFLWQTFRSCLFFRLPIDDFLLLQEKGGNFRKSNENFYIAAKLGFSFWVSCFKEINKQWWWETCSFFNKIIEIAGAFIWFVNFKKKILEYKCLLPPVKPFPSSKLLFITSIKIKLYCIWYYLLMVGNCKLSFLS